VTLRCVAVLCVCHQIRDAFLRLWVSLLKNHKQFVRSRAPGSALSPSADPDDPDAALGPSAEEMFDAAGFLDDAPAASRPFLKSLMETQMWARFVEERWSVSGLAPKDYPRDRDAVRFFEECIIAKANRTIVSSAFGRAQDTPFLNDHSQDISSTFLAPVPNMANLTDSTDHTLCTCTCTGAHACPLRLQCRRQLIAHVRDPFAFLAQCPSLTRASLR
jgi:hypothetical protein